MLHFLESNRVRLYSVYVCRRSLEVIYFDFDFPTLNEKLLCGLVVSKPFHVYIQKKEIVYLLPSASAKEYPDSKN